MQFQPWRWRTERRECGRGLNLWQKDFTFTHAASISDTLHFFVWSRVQFAILFLLLEGIPFIFFIFIFFCVYGIKYARLLVIDSLNFCKFEKCLFYLKFWKIFSVGKKILCCILVWFGVVFCFKALKMLLFHLPVFSALLMVCNYRQNLQSSLPLFLGTVYFFFHCF